MPSNTAPNAAAEAVGPPAGTPTDVAKLYNLLQQLRAVHNDFYAHLAHLIETAKAKQYAQPEMVDLGFLLRESETLLDDWRKDCGARKEFIAGVLAEKAIKESISSGDPSGMTVHGKMAHAVCDIDLIPAMPARESPEYAALAKHFGVDVAIAASPLFKLDFKEVKKHIVEHAAGIVTKIPGLGKKYPKYTAVFTRKKQS